MGALNIPAGAKQSALGGQGVSIYDDSFSFLHNPATLPLMQNSAGLNYKTWYADINIMQTAVNYKIESIGGFGLGFIHSGVTFDEYDETGKTIGELSPSDTILNIGYGRGLIENLSIGGGVVLLFNTLDDTQGATIFALNAGALYKLKISDFPIDAGMSIRNLGPAAKYEDYKASAPMHILAGVNVNLPWYNMIVPMEMGLKAEKFSFAFGLGAGYKIAGMGELNGYFGLPATDDVRQIAVGLEAGYIISGANQIKANFTYELLKTENVLNIGVSFSY